MNIAVIFAGGVGNRMNSKALPKQFLKVFNKEIIIYTLEEFEKHPEIHAIVIACVEDWIPFLENLINKYHFEKIRAIVPGGTTGQDSIYHGLQAADRCSDSKESIVLIHDGVRPLIDQKTITNCLKTVKVHRSAITVAPVIETIIRVNDEKQIEDVIDRSNCLLARAPQCFYLSDILSAHTQAILEEKHDFIDSATLMKAYGHTLATVEGPDNNIKITTPKDYYILKAILDERENRQLFGE